MSTTRIPRTDSVQELAQFWDTHDLTDFEDEVEEVAEVFERESVVKIRLASEEAEAVKSIAKSKGVDSPELIRQWVLEKVRKRA